MGKKKKQQITGFTEYMRDILPKLKATGELPANAGLAHCVPIAHPRWKNLPAPEKEKWERKAREEKAKASGASSSGVRADRLDNIGNLISQRVNKEEELEKKRKRESIAHENRWPTDAKELLEFKFYVIAFEYMCRTEEGEFLPAEVAIVQFSLKDGITDYFHRFINHGPIPLGYRFECQQHSDDTHQIPIDFELADENYLGIWTKMINFVNYCEEDRKYPPLYCLGADRQCVEYCIEWLLAQSRFGYEKNKLEKIFELENMVADLYARSENERLNRPSRTTIIESLTTSAWDYEYGTRCDWHEEKEVKDCALGKCKRFVYAISDTASNLWEDIELKPGQHLPVRDDEPPYEVINPGDVEVSKPSSSRGGRGRGFGRARPFSSEPPPAGGGYGARDVRLRDGGQDRAFSRNQFDDAFEDSYSAPFQPTLRRPNIPEDTPRQPFKMSPWAAPDSYAHMMPPKVNDTEEFPSLGASIHHSHSAPVMSSNGDFPTLGGIAQRFAGRREPPPASHAPSPPSNWNKPKTKPTIHDAVRMMEEEEERRAREDSYSPHTTDYFSDSSSASSHTATSSRKLTLQEAVQLQEQEEMSRQMKEMEIQKPRLPTTTPKALQAGLAPQTAGRSRGALGAPRKVNVGGGMGRGLGGLGGAGRGVTKTVNKPPINMGKPPSLVKAQDTNGVTSQSHIMGRGINMGQPPSQLFRKPIVEDENVSISGWSAPSTETKSQSLECGDGDNDDVASTSTATWGSIFSDLNIQPPTAFSGDASGFPTLSQSMSQKQAKPNKGRGRGVLLLADYPRPPPGFQKRGMED